jgi:hypothetical protein
VTYYSGGNLSRSGEYAGGLADLDQVAVGVPDIGADLTSMILWLGEELRALRRPFLADSKSEGSSFDSLGEFTSRMRHWSRLRFVRYADLSSDDLLS